MPQAAHKGEYPPDWPEVARSVKDEAGWRCARCDASHNYASSHVLTVHHFDGDKSNCSRWNLMPLCQRCHLSVQSRVNPAETLMFSPSVWAMPYIAGLYDAGRGVPSPLYDLPDWIRQYEQETHRGWPAWAPRPNDKDRTP